MFGDLTKRTVHQDWQSALLLFTLVAIVHFVAAFLKSPALTFVGLASFVVVSLLFVQKSNWRDINLKKPSHLLVILGGLIGAMILVMGSYGFLHLTVGYSFANYFVITAKSQMGYGVINKSNAWQFFPIAAIGFSTISPLAEELFFRGVLLKSLESRFSALKANVIQEVLFGLIHLAYMWVWEFTWVLLYTMVPLIALAGVLYGWVAQRTGSVFSSMLIHAFYNLLLILAVYSFIIPVVG